MPIYEYKCQDCGKVTEALVQLKNSNQILCCVHCKSENLRKIISSPATILIGEHSPKGKTCCGRDERCNTPPCSNSRVCRRD